MDRDQFYIKPERVQLKRLLTNEGGIGEVWLGTLHEESGQHDVAVKKYPSAVHEEERLMFTRETAVLFMAALRCHNVCKVYGTTNKDGKMCIVMKLYRESMLSRMRRYPGGKLPLAEVQRYGLEICKAVAELHDQNIISQDLKPPNFLIDDLDHCVVADFGISRVIEKTIGVHMPSNVQGTFNYMSPESFDPELFGGVTFKADSWSFACSLIEMLSGVKPWDGIKMAPIVRKVLNKEIPQIPPGLPSPLENLIRGCLNFNPNSRPTFHQMFHVFKCSWEPKPVSSPAIKPSMQMELVLKYSPEARMEFDSVLELANKYQEAKDALSVLQAENRKLQKELEEEYLRQQTHLNRVDSESSEVFDNFRDFQGTSYGRLQELEDTVQKLQSELIQEKKERLSLEVNLEEMDIVLKERSSSEQVLQGEVKRLNDQIARMTAGGSQSQQDNRGPSKSSWDEEKSALLRSFEEEKRNIFRHFLLQREKLEAKVQEIESAFERAIELESKRRTPDRLSFASQESKDSDSVQSLDLEKAGFDADDITSKFSSSHPSYQGEEERGGGGRQDESSTADRTSSKSSSASLGLYLDSTRIIRILPGSIAARAGLTEGDEIKVINGALTNSSTCGPMLREGVGEQELDLTVNRRGHNIKISVFQGEAGKTSSMRDGREIVL